MVLGAEREPRFKPRARGTTADGVLDSPISPERRPNAAREGEAGQPPTTPTDAGLLSSPSAAPAAMTAGSSCSMLRLLKNRGLVIGSMAVAAGKPSLLLVGPSEVKLLGAGALAAGSMFVVLRLKWG